MITTTLYLLSILTILLLSLPIPTTHAHPGAVADGRATCGTEYSTPLTAYTIPDVAEAWFLRRVATCENPVFWTRFEITQTNQQLYLAVISPEIQRFQDQLTWNAILYGPGLTNDADNGFYPIPENLPAGVRSYADELGVGGAYLQSPSDLADCAFVDTNVVMRRFSDVIEGRCMERFVFDSNYQDALQAGSTVNSWWLYSFNHRAAQPGVYFLQSWLSSSNDDNNNNNIIINDVAQGKYEITMGPWAWSGYASQATLDLAQSQGTSCSCAVNAIDYREQNLPRHGLTDETFYTQQLPGGSCASTPPPTSACVTIPQRSYLSPQSVIEWSGVWELQSNHTYEWTFFAYYQGSGDNYEYPDPGMFVFLVDVTFSSKTSVETLADETLVPAMNDTVPLRDGDELSTDGNKAEFIEFSNRSTTVLIRPSRSMTLAVFTQHVPSEFMAHVLFDQTTGEYLFPTNLTAYTDGLDGWTTDPPSTAEPSGSARVVQAKVPWMLTAILTGVWASIVK